MAWHLTLEILKYTKKILGSGLGPPRPRGPWHLSSLVQWVLRHWSRKLATLLDMSSMISCFVCVFYIVFDTQPDISLNREINTLTESDAKPVWLSGNTVSLDQRSYSTLGPVSAWMGDRLGRVNQLGADQGTRVYSAWAVGMQNEYSAKAGERENTGTLRDTLARIRGLAVWAGVWLKS